MYSFSYLESVCFPMSSSNCCFLTCIKVTVSIYLICLSCHNRMLQIGHLPIYKFMLSQVWGLESPRPSCPQGLLFSCELSPGLWMAALLCPHIVKGNSSAVLFSFYKGISPTRSGPALVISSNPNYSLDLDIIIVGVKASTQGF